MKGNSTSPSQAIAILVDNKRKLVDRLKKAVEQ